MIFLQSCLFVPTSKLVKTGEVSFIGAWHFTGAEVYVTVYVVALGCNETSEIPAILSKMHKSCANDRNKQITVETYLNAFNYGNSISTPSAVLAKVQNVFGKNYTASDIVYIS